MRKVAQDERGAGINSCTECMRHYILYMYIPVCVCILMLCCLQTTYLLNGIEVITYN